MPTLSRIAVYPVKSLDPEEPERVSITDAGGLRGDRAYAVVDEEGEYVNGKRTPNVHRVRTDVDLDARAVAVRIEGGDARTFDLEDDRDRDALDALLSDHFGLPVTVVAAGGENMTDSSDPGPTLVSRATLEEVASWFPGIDAEGMYRRIRPNLVVEGAPAFWEDRLVTDGIGEVRIGGATLRARKSVPRCVVPTRDPRTGEPYEGFRETFIRRREEMLPEWGDPEALDGLFSLTVSTHVPPGERGTELAVGDDVEIVGDVP